MYYFLNKKFPYLFHSIKQELNSECVLTVAILPHVKLLLPVSFVC